MTSRFATFILFFSLACATSVFAQTGYYYQPAPQVYPQTQPAVGGNAGSPTGFSRLPQPVASMPAHLIPAPLTSVYQPLVAAPPAQNPVYQQPVAARAPANHSYWTELNPPTSYPAPQQQRGLPQALPHSYYAPHPAYAPVSHAYGGPAGPPAHAPAMPGPEMQLGPAIQQEGSVLQQMPTPQNFAPYDNFGGYAASGPGVVSGGTGYGGSATPGMYGLAGAGYGYGNARFGIGTGGCTTPWFVGFGGLIMTRDNEDHYLFSYDSFDESIQWTNARDANFDWAGGLEVRFGRFFNCGQNAVEAVYWGLFPSDGTTTTSAGDVVGNLNGILNWDQLDYGLDPFLLPRTADEFVNNSTMHQVQRMNEIHNIEVNLLTYLSGAYGGMAGTGGCGGMCGGACGGASCSGMSSAGSCGGCASCSGAVASGKGYGHYGGNGLAGIGNGRFAAAARGSRWSHDWLLGVRYFSFRDRLLFGAEETGGNGIFAFDDDEIYYNIDLENRLVGVQLGSSGAFAVNCRCSLDYGIKLGIYGNQISHTSEIGGSQGVAVINNGPNAGIDFLVDNSKTDISFLGEANLGASWKFGNCWSARIGYRAVAVTGIAMPSSQIYHDLRGIQDVRLVGSNDSLILHGGYARAEYRF